MDTVNKVPGIAASMQPLAAGDLQDFMLEIHHAQHIPSTIRNVLKLLVTADLLRGMRQQIEAFVTHNDIKPPNFLVTCSGDGDLSYQGMKAGTLGGSFATCNTGNLRTYYADYGLACAKQGRPDLLCPGLCGSLCGTPGWIPPEELDHGKKYDSPEGDLWAVGEMMYYIWFGAYAPSSFREHNVVLPTPDRGWVHPSKMIQTQTGWDTPQDWRDPNDWGHPETVQEFDNAPAFDMDSLPLVLDLFGLRQDISDLMAALLGPAAQRVTVVDEKGQYQDMMNRIIWQADCIRVLKSGNSEQLAQELKTLSREARIADIKAKIRPGRKTTDDGMFMASQGCGLGVGSHQELEELLSEAESAFSMLMKEASKVKQMQVKRIYEREREVAYHFPAAEYADKPWWEAPEYSGPLNGDV